MIRSNCQSRFSKLILVCLLISGCEFKLQDRAINHPDYDKELENRIELVGEYSPIEFFDETLLGAYCVLPPMACPYEILSSIKFVAPNSDVSEIELVACNYDNSIGFLLAVDAEFALKVISTPKSVNFPRTCYLSDDTKIRIDTDSIGVVDLEG